jgi:hypothetical protein
MHVGDTRCAIARAHLVADRVHEVVLPRPTPPNEQRVVRRPVLADLDRRGARELIALAFDEDRT